MAIPYSLVRIGQIVYRGMRRDEKGKVIISLLSGKVISKRKTLREHLIKVRWSNKKIEELATCHLRLTKPGSTAQERKAQSREQENKDWEIRERKACHLQTDTYSTKRT